jgi:hypothetical protein
MDDSICAALDQYLKLDQQEETRKQISNLSHQELKLRLFSRMQFGTAGLRAQMGAGYTRMNQLTGSFVSHCSHSGNTGHLSLFEITQIRKRCCWS